MHVSFYVYSSGKHVWLWYYILLSFLAAGAGKGKWSMPLVNVADNGLCEVWLEYRNAPLIYFNRDHSTLYLSLVWLLACRQSGVINIVYEYCFIRWIVYIQHINLQIWQVGYDLVFSLILKTLELHSVLHTCTLIYDTISCDLRGNKNKHFIFFYLFESLIGGLLDHHW